MAICLDFDWQTNEFMLYCRSSQYKEKHVRTQIVHSEFFINLLDCKFC